MFNTTSFSTVGTCNRFDRHLSRLCWSCDSLLVTNVALCVISCFIIELFFSYTPSVQLTWNSLQTLSSTVDSMSTRVMFFSSEVRVAVMLRDSLGFRRLAHTLVDSPDSRTAGMTTVYSLQTQRQSREAHHWFWEVGNREEDKKKTKNQLNHLTHFKPHTHAHTYGPATTWPTHMQVKRTQSVHVHVWTSGRPMTDWVQPQGQHLLNSHWCRKPPPLLISVTQQ